MFECLPVWQKGDRDWRNVVALHVLSYFEYAIVVSTHFWAILICYFLVELSLRSRFGSKHPSRVSSATSPMHSRDHLWISLSKSSGSSLRSSSSCWHRSMNSSVTCSSGDTYRRTVDSWRTGFWTRERNSRHGSPWLENKKRERQIRLPGDGTRSWGWW